MSRVMASAQGFLRADDGAYVFVLAGVADNAEAGWEWVWVSAEELQLIAPDEDESS